MGPLTFYALKGPYGQTTGKFAYAISPVRLPHRDENHWVPATEFKDRKLDRVRKLARDHGIAIFRVLYSSD